MKDFIQVAVDYFEGRGDSIRKYYYRYTVSQPLTTGDIRDDLGRGFWNTKTGSNSTNPAQARRELLEDRACFTHKGLALIEQLLERDEILGLYVRQYSVTVWPKDGHRSVDMRDAVVGVIKEALFCKCGNVQVEDRTFPPFNESGDARFSTLRKLKVKIVAPETNDGDSRARDFNYIYTHIMAALRLSDCVLIAGNRPDDRTGEFELGGTGKQIKLAAKYLQDVVKVFPGSPWTWACECECECDQHSESAA